MPENRPALGPAFQSVFLIVAIDILAGCWLAIHREKALEFFVSQVPLIGAAGVLWSFFPKETKDNFGKWLEWSLGRIWLRLALALGLITLSATTFFRVSSNVTLLSDTATWLYLAADRGRGPGPDEILDSTRLNRITSPASVSRWGWPSGLLVWWYTPTMITHWPLKLRSWQPATVTYPQDFDSLAVLVVLPGGWLFNKFPGGTVRIVVRETNDPGDTVATFSLEKMGSYAVSFLKPDLSPEDSVKWRDLVIDGPDSASASIVARWGNGNWVRALRPIRLGENLTLTLSDPRQELHTYKRTLDHATSQVYLVP